MSYHIPCRFSRCAMIKDEDPHLFCKYFSDDDDSQRINCSSTSNKDYNSMEMRHHHCKRIIHF